MLGSGPRIADFGAPPLATQRVPRGPWAFGDYVVADVRSTSTGWAGGFERERGMDAGLLTTVCPPEEYREVEAGAAPLEQYDGATLVEVLGDNVPYTNLCASDPYAVQGIIAAWPCDLDLAGGRAANTAAGIQLVRRPSSLVALDLTDEESRPESKRRPEQVFGKGPRDG